MFGVGVQRPALTPRSSNSSLKQTKSHHIPDPTTHHKSPYSPTNSIHTHNGLNSSGPALPDCILPNLYLTDLITTRGVLLPSFSELAVKSKTPNIKYILSVLDNSLNQPKPRPGPLYAGRDATFVQKLILLDDVPDANLLAILDDSCDWIEQSINNGDGGVLVHCHLGQSRSASIVIAYMMRKQGLTYEEALEKVKRKRSLVKPNVGFVKQLQLWGEMGCTIYEVEPVMGQPPVEKSVEKAQEDKDLLPATVVVQNESEKPQPTTDPQVKNETVTTSTTMEGSRKKKEAYLMWKEEQRNTVQKLLTA